ncbi:membrane hypothetical protein [Alphaproteobacteria bacterium]
MGIKIHFIDISIILLYLVITLVMGLYVSKISASVKEYILGSGNYKTPFMIACFIATIVGAGTTIAVAEKSFTDGFSYAVVSTLGCSLGALFSIKFIVPKFKNYHGLVSVGDIMERHYGLTARRITGIIGFIFCIGALGTQIFALGVVIKYIVEADGNLIVIIIGLIFTLYSALGGGRGIIATHMFQFIILIMILPLISGISIDHVGGLGALFNKIPEHYTKIWKNENYYIYISLFFWCFLPGFGPDQIRNYLMTKDTRQLKDIIKASLIIEGPIRILVAIIGMSAYVLFHDIDPNQAILYIIGNTLPIGLQGLAFAALLAIIMSTADSLLSSGVIVLVHDFVKTINTKLTAKMEVFIIKISTICIGISAILVAVHCRDIIYTLVVFGCLYTLFVDIPLLGAILGFQSSTRNYKFNYIFVIPFFILGNFFCKTPKYINFIYVISFLSCFFIMLSGDITGYVKQWNLLYKNNRYSFSNIYQYIRKLVLYCKNNISVNKLNAICADKIQEYGAEYFRFGVFVCITYIIPYWIWPSYTEKAALIMVVRILVGLMAMILLLRDLLPKVLKKYLPLYWYITLMICIPFYSTLISIEAVRSSEWIMQAALSSFILVSLVGNWVTFLILNTVGITLGMTLYSIFSSTYVVQQFTNHNMISMVYMYITIYVVSMVFVRKKNIDDFRENKKSHGICWGYSA